MESLTEAMPYCQIVKGKVSAKTCAETQGQDGCFGCAAKTRKCEYCKEAMVEIPAVGLCNTCVKLLTELEMEREPRADSLPEKLACIKCHIRPIHFKEYKMCLRCSAEEYGRDLSAENLKKNPTKDDSPEKRVLSFSKKTTKKAISLLPEARKLVIKSGNASANHIFKNLKGISYVTAEKLLQLLEEEGIVAPSGSKYGRRKVIASQPENIVIKKLTTYASDKVKQKATDLLPEAKALILRHQSASHKLLRKNLKIGHVTANLILAELEAEKFIGPYHGKRKSRVILAQAPAVKQPKAMPKEFSLDQKTSKLESLINVVGGCELSEIIAAIIKDLVAFDEIKKVINK